MTLDPVTFPLFFFSFFFFFFFLNRGAPILKETVAVLVTASSYSLLVLVTAYSLLNLIRCF